MLRILGSTLFLFISFLVNSLSAQMPGTQIGSFEKFSDIGFRQIKGSASYREPDQTYHLKGAGSNIWFGQDSFAFLSKTIKGDFIMQTRVKLLGKGNELHRKAGIMIRSSPDPHSAMVSCSVHGDGLTSLQYRKTAGGTMQEIKFKISGPDMLQLEKKGNLYTMSVAHFGERYQVEKIDSIDLGNDLQAGLFICSHSNKYAEEAEFSNTRIFAPAADDLVQYNTYLGSLLEIMDVENGNREVLSGDAGSIQAPNWTPDGKSLIYNGSGKLFRFDIATRIPVVINTDFANKNNNDHVLTFDGTQLGISHHPEETAGKSVVYTVPVTGGIPKKITHNAPSYFHGWSPDNQFLLYTGERNGDYDIYRIGKEGGEEEQLTHTKGLDDGSEYSPDGRYIYFCSVRSGTMQVWRMDADGKNQTQLTFDELNNWFPHVSPDNKKIVFISFPKEVPPDQHPFYKRVYIRMISIDGGPIKTIGYLYGGQGTMNVPNWSPDSQKIAFVSNGTFEK